MTPKDQATLDQEAAKDMAQEFMDGLDGGCLGDFKQFALECFEYGRANPIQPVSKGDEERASEYVKRMGYGHIYDSTIIGEIKKDFTAGMLDERRTHDSLVQKQSTIISKLEAQLAKQESAVQGLVEALEFYAQGYCDHERDYDEIVSGERKPKWKKPMTYGEFARKALKKYEESRGK